MRVSKLRPYSVHRWTLEPRLHTTYLCYVLFIVGGAVNLRLYHAVAREHEDALLVTAEERYYGKAESHGTITTLHDWAAVA